MFKWLRNTGGNDAPTETKTTINLTDHEWWRAASGGNSAGVNVTHATALQVSTVLACCRVIAEDVAKLPLILYRREDGRKIEAVQHRYYNTLRHRPNRWMSSFEFRESLTMHAALTGNAFALKAGDSLIPLVPGQVTIVAADEPVYEVRDHNGEKIGTFGARDILHLRGPSWDTRSGMDMVKQAREAIGLAIATEKSQSTLHKNGGRPGGILSTTEKLSRDVIQRLRLAWESMHKGENSNGTAVLDQGIKFHPIAMSGVDAQHIETRKLQIEEVCRAFKVFPQMIGHSDKATTYASAEAFFSAHFRQTIWPWVERWQQALDRDLLDRSGPLFVEFKTSDFTKAELKDRAEAYRSFTEMGIYTRNELRELEGLPPLPGLDEPLTPMNMTGAENDESGA